MTLRKGHVGLLGAAAVALSLLAPAAAQAAPAPNADPTPVFCQYRVNYAKSPAFPIRSAPSPTANVVYRLANGSLIRAASNVTRTGYRETSDFHWGNLTYLVRTSAPCQS
jgi:hypothetical protein